MSPKRRNGVYYMDVPKPLGGAVLRTTETHNVAIYRKMKRLIQQLRDERRWGLLMPVIERRLTIGHLYDAWAANGLDKLERSLSWQALTPHSDRFIESCTARGLAPRNVENIRRQIDRFLGWRKDATTNDLNPATVTAWLSTLTQSPGTRRQYLFALTGFTRYLVDVGVLDDYPLSRVKAPKKNLSRMTYMDAATDERIVQAANPTYRMLFALIKATGADVTTALALRHTDLDLAAGTVRLRGTKTAQRDVHEAVIEPWALKYLTRQPFINAPLFEGVTRHGAYRHHERCCYAVGVADYTLRDSRHSVAVRMMKAGYNVMEIAEQLGNSPELVARIYARFTPKMELRRRETGTDRGTQAIR